MKVLVTGAGGMVGRAVAELCAVAGDEVLACDHRRPDITDDGSVRATFAEWRPEAVINCAAWTDVDGCESDSRRAYEANARGPELLAINSRRVGATLVTISTDYVFDGAKEGFYTQRDDPDPQSVYGAAKLEGERRALAASARTAIVRTGWIFGPGGRNFLSLVLDLANRGTPLKVISDAYGTPTSARDLAARLRELAVLDLPGIYHVTNSGPGASFEEFARFTLQTARLDSSSIEPVLMDTLSRPAPRPRNSRLRCLLSEAIGLAPLPDWQSAVRDFVARRR